MSEADKKKDKAAGNNPKQPNIYEILDKQQKQINDLTQGLVDVAKAVGQMREGRGGGKKKELGTLGDVLGAILGGDKKGASIDDMAKNAESMVRLSEAMDRFRHPSRLGYGEALLMRAGVRAALPRYMTKAEMRKFEKQVTAWEEGEEEGEHEHISPE
ncbi:MAG: hypothetical protein HWN51_02890 [Desulfobacterales bacterium]|nr:hypothetical protein [Desulfobacterales bacterium]